MSCTLELLECQDGGEPDDVLEPGNEPESGGGADTTPALRADSLADGVVLLMALTVGQRMIGFLRNIFFCRLLDPAELGRWNLAFSLLMLAAPLAVLGLPGSFGRYVEHFRQRGQLRTFLRRTIAVSTVLGLAGVILLYLGQRWVSWLVFGRRDETVLLHTICLALMAVIVFNFLVELFIALRQVRTVSYMQFSNSFVFATVGLGLLWFTPFGVTGVLVAYAVGCLLSSAGAIWQLKSTWVSLPLEPQWLPQRELWGKLVPFAAWIWATNLLANLFTAADRYMIIHFSTCDADGALSLVGQYHSSRVVGDLMIAVATLVGGVILPYMTHDWERGRHRAVTRRLNLSLKLAGLMLVAGAIAVLIVAPVLFGWALAGKYAAGQAVLPWTLAFCAWFGLVVIAQNYLWCAEKARLGSLALLVGLLANLALNYLLLPRLGLLGAVLATAVANALVLCVILWLTRRLGMRLCGGTLIVSALPLCLGLGTWPALAIWLVVTWLGVSRGWIFSTRETLQLTGLAARYVQRAARMLDLPGVASS